VKKTFVLDTCVFLSDPSCLKHFDNNDIIIPLKVLDEIDKNKARQDGAGFNARYIIRILDVYRTKGSLVKGVSLGDDKGKLFVKHYDTENLPHDFDLTVPDNQIIATALTEKSNYKRKKIIVVSQDINMRVKCDALGLLCEDYIAHDTVDSKDEVFTGFSQYLVDEQVIDSFYSGDEIYAYEEEISLNPNQYVMLVSNSNDKKTALARFFGYNSPLKKLYKNEDVWGISARNKEQTFALDLLMDSGVEVVSLIGQAGSGKTLLAVAAGLEQVLGEESKYKKLIVSRPVQPLGKDIGFLPGTLEEKMDPWLMPIKDNLEFLMGNDRYVVQDYFEKGVIEIEAITYIRGRSITNAFIIIDEAQNLTRHELKTILTRVGEGTKIILTGDIEQIDNIYIDETSNGLTYAVEKFKNYDISGHITLQKGERSKVATLAAKIL
tara:strand:- start:6817 stop:8124 length:1308 start_codon:yes stop_codon:yes gene_type:complete